MQNSQIIALALLLPVLVPESAVAHTEGGVPGGFLSGFTHPILGWDHVIAMVAVGLWGAFLGVPALWLLPVVFPLVMAAGAALGFLGVPLPAVETGIAASGMVLGLLILLAARFPLWLAIAIVGAFAIFQTETERHQRHKHPRERCPDRGGGNKRRPGNHPSNPKRYGHPVQRARNQTDGTDFAGRQGHYT